MIIGDDDESRARKAEMHRRIMKASKKQENRSANVYRGSRNAGSGSGWLRKNDVRAEHLLIENKLTTNAKSYTIKHKDLTELTQRAILDDRLPVLQFDLGGKHYIILNEDDFLTLLGNMGD
jgi:hypothetical protein